MTNTKPEGEPAEVTTECLRCGAADCDIDHDAIEDAEYADLFDAQREEREDRL